MIRRWFAPLALFWLFATTTVAAIGEPVDDYVAAALVDAKLAKNAAARCESKAEKAAALATDEVLVRAKKAQDECRLLKNDGARAEYALKAAQAERVKQKTPSAVALPPITVSLGDVTYTFKAADKRQPFNATDRYEIPLVEGLHFVLLDTPSIGHASYVVERRKPGIYGAPLPLLDYTITIRDPRYSIDRTQSVTAHGQWQRWRLQSKDWPAQAAANLAWVFKVSPRAKSPGLATVPEVTPLFTGGLKTAMGTTGLRPDIGPYTGWLARAIRTGDYAAARRNAEATGSIPWHIRDDAGRPVLLSGPANILRQIRTHYGTHSSLANTIDENTAWSMDYAHMPKAAMAGFVLSPGNPDPYIVEELQFEAAAAIGQAANSYDRTSNGLMLVRVQGRDYAWGMVSLVHALVATPEDAPDWLIPRAKIVELVEANLRKGVELSQQPGFQFHSVALGKKKGATALGATTSQSNVIDYIPLAMLHCYRLTGDERFIQIGRAHLDGRMAKRWKASPKYAALYPPVTIGTGDGWRFPVDWAEAYAAKGWTSKPGDETGSWVRPTGKEVGADGKALMAYGYDEMIPYTMLIAKAYQAAGFSTPDIDWLADYLEQRSGGASFTIHEQFAVTL
jgi:hypothetical protein